MKQIKGCKRTGQTYDVMDVDEIESSINTSHENTSECDSGAICKCKVGNFRFLGVFLTLNNFFFNFYTDGWRFYEKHYHP